MADIIPNNPEDAAFHAVDADAAVQRLEGAVSLTATCL
jgi:hypothetical protein